MDIVVNYLAKNSCYITGASLKPKGIMVHSTACPGVMHQNFLTSWNVPKPNNVSVCVHGFLDDTGFYQTLPWTMKGWHAGGRANSELIGFEICEPKNYADKKYFENVKHRTIELCVFLCQKFNLSADTITTHCEGYQRYGSSYASNHGDIHHWWKVYHGYTISDLRKDVKNELERLKRIEVDEKMLQEYIDIYGEEVVRAGLAKIFEAEKNKNIPANWATKELQEAIDAGITDGTRPQDFATREEVAIMVKRGAKK